MGEKRTRRWRYFTVLLLVTMIMVGCNQPQPTPVPTAVPEPTPTEAVMDGDLDAGGGDTDTVTGSGEVAETETEPTTSPKSGIGLGPAGDSGSGAVSTLADVKSAVVQIEAEGTFIDPEVGLQLNAAGRGSGFIIDPEGIAVTNNHVATGAAFLKVWVGGESEPRNAKILGVSECSDLAVIDIDGDGYPYLEWYDGSITPGLEVYAAGFPLGDPEFTLTRGIVSKERAGGESDWASVDYVIEHDARLNPGNSGGPLVTEDGQVVGVNYAGNDAEQSFAIGRNEAQGVIEELRAGQDVTSIGINGQVVDAGDGTTGIWVASVKSGSPADQAGIKAGDIITHLEGLLLGTDGTMADYCDILRSHNPDDVLGVTVLRYATQEVLEGQLNGRELETTFSFAQELQDDVEDQGSAASASYSGYMGVEDDTGAIYMEVPYEWSDVRGDLFTDNDGSPMGASITAAADLDAFGSAFDVPGVLFIASRQLAQNYNEETLLNEVALDTSCASFEGRYDYDDGLYTGYYDLYTGCGDGGVVVQVAAVPEDRSYIMLVSIQVMTDADLEAVDRIFASFIVQGDLP